MNTLLSLDVSDLEPPEPLERIIAAVTTLQADQALVVTHRREPFPLYKALSELGFASKSICLSVNVYQILIWPDGRDDLYALARRSLPSCA